MNFGDKITGNDMTKEMKGFESRAKKVPVDYQVAWEEGAKSFSDKWRKQLNNNITKKLENRRMKMRIQDIIV